MKVLFHIGHPGHIHLFKNLMWALRKKGHECKISAIDKDVSINLLNAYSLDYTITGSTKTSSIFSKAFEQLKVEHSFYNMAQSFKPDLLVGGPGGLCVSHIGVLIGVPSIVFDDTEHSKLEHLLMDRFATFICTPSCYKSDLGNKQIKYNGYHELAYLHPNHFTPNPNVLNELGLSLDDNIFLVRFAAFNATHDVNTESFKPEYVSQLIQKLENHGKIMLFSEKKIDPSLEKYLCHLSPEMYHDLLYYSKIYIGEGSTSAEEAAMLGVPSLHFERLNLNGKLYNITSFIGVLDELQNNYGLLYSFHEEKKLLDKLDELLSDINDVKHIWNFKREKLLQDKIDVTAFLVWLVENYPKSIPFLLKNPDFQDRFK